MFPEIQLHSVKLKSATSPNLSLYNPEHALQSESWPLVAFSSTPTSICNTDSCAACHGEGENKLFMLIMWKASTSSEVHFKRALDSLDSCMKFIKIYPNFALTSCWSIIFSIITSWQIHWVGHIARMEKVRGTLKGLWWKTRQPFGRSQFFWCGKVWRTEGLAVVGDLELSLLKERGCSGHQCFEPNWLVGFAASFIQI